MYSWVYLGVKICEVFLCFEAIVRVRVYYVNTFIPFVLCHCWVLQVFTPRMSLFLSQVFWFIKQLESSVISHYILIVDCPTYSYGQYWSIVQSI